MFAVNAKKNVKRWLCLCQKVTLAIQTSTWKENELSKLTKHRKKNMLLKQVNIHHFLASKFVQRMQDLKDGSPLRRFQVSGTDAYNLPTALPVKFFLGQVTIKKLRL